VIEALCAAAAVLLGGALQISDGTFDPAALTLATAAAGLAAFAARRGRIAESGPEERLQRLAQVVLGYGVVLGVACTLLASPTSEAPARSLGGVRALVPSALILVSAYLSIHLRASLLRVRFAALVAIFVAMGIAAVQLSPHPWIDTWVFEQMGAEAFLRGANPYSIDYPNIYAGGLDRVFYAAEMLRDGHVTIYPYPPLTLLAGTLSQALFGDVRYAGVAELAIAAVAIARLGGKPGSGTRARTTAELAALFVLFQPRTLLVLEKAWTEPLVLCCVALTLLAVQRFRERAPAGAVLAGLAAGALVASKQYAPLLLLPLVFAAPREGRGRAALAALVVPALTLAPFALWDWQELFNDLLRAHVLQPLRLDSLSLVALWARAGGAASPSLAILGFVAAALVIVLTLPRRPALGQAALVAAAAFFWFVLLNKQAHCNYLWLVASLLAVACAQRTREIPAAEAVELPGKPLALSLGRQAPREPLSGRV
jgi:hypothetical protein